MIIKPYSLIEIEWDDASYNTNAGWRTEKEAENWLNEQVSYLESGYFIRKNKKFILICGGYFKDKPDSIIQVSGVRVIPIGCIKKITKLK